LRKNTNAIHDGIGVLHSAFDRIRIADIRLHGLYLTDASQRLQEMRKIWPTHGDPHAVALLSKQTHSVASNKPRPAKNRHKRRRSRKNHKNDATHANAPIRR
jgi:hypothetical protein